MRVEHIFLTIALGLTLTTRVAHAEAGAVLVYGNAKPHERQVVAAAVTRTVREASWSVVDAPFEPREIDDIIICLALDRPWSCMARIANASGIGRVVIVQVEPEPGGSIIVIGQVLLASTAVPSTERRFCDPCSDASLDQSARELTSILLDRTIAREGNTAIEVHTIPQGASITIDGNMVGASDRTIMVSAGPHQVQLQRSGYRPYSEQIVIAEGQTFTLNTTLTASDPASQADDGKPSRLVPGLIGGAGALALVGGGVYSLTTSPPTSFEQSRYLYSGPGLAIAAAGGAALGVGLYLWFHHPKQRSTPTVSYTSHGGLIGWSASF